MCSLSNDIITIDIIHSTIIIGEWIIQLTLESHNKQYFVFGQPYLIILVANNIIIITVKPPIKDK